MISAIEFRRGRLSVVQVATDAAPAFFASQLRRASPTGRTPRQAKLPGSQGSMTILQQSPDAEAIRHDLRLLRKRIAGLNDRAGFGDVDALLSVAEAHVDQHLAALRHTGG
ncbi:hypothetical protein SLT36_21105 [Aminobacter sp. BA135]|uniref:hypothetical protein n=1 Tax=Aminobacter sp. BA135 TaxID=537596 RepID=UPI003D79A561